LLLPVGNSTIFSGSSIPISSILSKLPPIANLSDNKEASLQQKSMLASNKDAVSQDFGLSDVITAAPVSKELQQVASEGRVLSRDSLVPPPPLKHMITKGVTITSEEGIISRDVLSTQSVQEQQQQQETPSQQQQSLKQPQEGLQVAAAGVSGGSRSGGEPVEDDPDGDKIPGMGGVDYPVLTTIPVTGFLCTPRMFKSGKMFADPETSCQ
ncbi:hypothetical protein OTU49_016110, partial [Cherax quadricarinatus]